MLIEEIKNIKSDKKELNQFGKTIGIMLVLISIGLFFIENKFFFFFSIAGLIFILTGIILPFLLLPFQKLWMAIAVVLGFLSTRIILTFLFYFIMTPIKLIAKLFGNSFLDLKFETDKSSYWNKRKEQSYNSLDSEKQF